MKSRTKVLLIMLVVILVIQLPFFTPAENATTEDQNIDISNRYEVPLSVQIALNDACYDCHSNNTKKYPWYYHIQPVSWWMNMHIRRAKSFVNFSEFAAYPKEKAIKKFDEINSVIGKRTMPLNSYLWMHEEARLSDKQYNYVAKWAADMREQLKKEVGNLPDTE